MPEILSQLSQSGATAQPAPPTLTPMNEQAYQAWRQQKVAYWRDLGSKRGMPDGSPNDKTQMAVQYYSTDSPALRQEFMRELPTQGIGQGLTSALR